uniref:Uncharacterized protein n=1 Tax=Photinus pyralis TaxID=7054 RepID=A0A1Y1N333_PHOPY
MAELEDMKRGRHYSHTSKSVYVDSLSLRYKLKMDDSSDVKNHNLHFLCETWSCALFLDLGEDYVPLRVLTFGFPNAFLLKGRLSFRCRTSSRIAISVNAPSRLDTTKKQSLSEDTSYSLILQSRGSRISERTLRLRWQCVDLKVLSELVT